MLILCVPSYREKEIQWVCNVLFSEMLGIDIQIEVSNQDDFILNVGDKQLKIANVFFKQTRENWLSLVSIPLTPLNIWQPKNFPNYPDFLTDNSLPIIFGDSNFESYDNSIELGLDIFGSAFFMLSRYEELVISERDIHNRFASTYSLAGKANFLFRPIVDEYTEILWRCIEKLFPQVQRKIKNGKVLVTCDVDAPYDQGLKNYKFLVREFAEDILKRRNLKMATNRFINFFASRFGNHSFDPNNTFDWYMDVCEKYGHKIAFYFITDNTAGKIDGCYSLVEKQIKELLQKIDARGHEIGVHSSFNTYKNPNQLHKERMNFVDACLNLDINQFISGNRQHFLRFDVKETPCYLQQAGYIYDTTGGFANSIGFRFGTAHTFSMWGWLNNEALKLKQKPLIMMEVSVFNYMKLSYSSETLQLLQTLKKNALRYGGNFTLLWHNDNFFSEKDKLIFEALLEQNPTPPTVTSSNATEN